MKKLYFLPFMALSAVFVACDEDEDVNPKLEVPATYTFERNGESTVDYSGQTTRLDMLAEIKTYIGTANAGAVLSEQKLLEMYANENNAFEDDDLNTASSKQLEDKTFLTDVTFYKDLFTSAASASEAGAENVQAAEGQAGLIERGTSGKFILVDEKGWEYTQLVEKGLMGSVFLNQIYNSYLTDAKTGDDVENEALKEGKNYTEMEHHWDEAFGYWGISADFDAASTNRFWGNYAYGRESLLGSVTALKDAFLKGRTAIVNKDYATKNEQKAIIYEQFELLAAATAIHYINEAMSDKNGGDLGNLFHHASEGYAFVRALKFSPVKEISDAQLEVILNENFGTDGDFWTITTEGLQEAKATLATVYPELAAVADNL